MKFETKGVTKYEVLFSHTQPSLLYLWLLQKPMEEQNLYMLHILNRQSCINNCNNDDDDDNNNNNNNNNSSNNNNNNNNNNADGNSKFHITKLNP